MLCLSDFELYSRWVPLFLIKYCLKSSMTADNSTHKLPTRRSVKAIL